MKRKNQISKQVMMLNNQTKKTKKCQKKATNKKHLLKMSLMLKLKTRLPKIILQKHRRILSKINLHHHKMARMKSQRKMTMTSVKILIWTMMTRMTKMKRRIRKRKKMKRRQKMEMATAYKSAMFS